MTCCSLTAATSGMVVGADASSDPLGRPFGYGPIFWDREPGRLHAQIYGELN